ncbi:MAG: SDR family NAD(P)-dependent oxidoreductase [Deltaproteobacteria bacterium]|nr:MAG: SDR family NAD(P)-dependent oxidoreductase [Deltaproteobacteria bacterium]
MPIGGGTRAVVTGAGSGLGRAFARVLASRGAVVVVADVREDTARETAREVGSLGAEAHVVVCDVTRTDDVARLAAQASTLAGEVDLLVNNAGIGAAGEVGVAGLDTWRRAIDVNLCGVIHGCHYFVPRMRARGRGHVLNVASAAAIAAAPGMGAYNVTKAGVVALSETLAAEAARDGVGVTVLMPGFFPTNIVHDTVGPLEDGKRRLAETMMQRSRYSADDVARLALRAVERGKLYALPHGEIRWLWRVKRAAPRTYARLVAALERRGVFSQA